MLFVLFDSVGIECELWNRSHIFVMSIHSLSSFLIVNSNTNLQRSLFDVFMVHYLEIWESEEQFKEVLTYGTFSFEKEKVPITSYEYMTSKGIS